MDDWVWDLKQTMGFGRLKCDSEYVVNEARKEIIKLRKLVKFHEDNARENASDIKALRSEFGRFKAKLRELCSMDI